MTDERIPTEAELLAPWFTTRKLGRAEEQMVREAMSDPKFARQMELAEDERRGTVEVVERIPAPSRQSLDKLMEMIDAEPSRAPGLMAKLKSAIASFGISGAPAGVVMAGLAMAVVLQTGILNPDSIGDADIGPTESVAEADPGLTRSISESGVLLRVEFTDMATMGEITALLDDLGASIRQGPVSGQYFLEFETEVQGSTAMVKLEAMSGLVAYVDRAGE